MPRLYQSRLWGNGSGSAALGALTLSARDNGDGTGVTATVAGAGGGTTTVYAAPAGNATGPAAWVAVGTLAGSGAVVVDPGAGLSFLYAANQTGGALSTSPPVLAARTAGAAVYTQILDSVAAVVASLGLSDASRVLPVVVRKVPGAGLFTEVPPLVIVAPSEEGETDTPWSTEDEVQLGYKVDVLIVGPAKGDPSRNRLDEWLGFRQRVRRAFQGGFLPGTTVYKVDVLPLSPVDRAKWFSYLFSGLKLVFWLIEPRT